MKNSGRTALLVGASGFVGPWVARSLLEHGWDVIGLARRDYRSPGDGGTYRSVQADAADPRCREWVESADAVVFNAAHIPANTTSAAEAEACVRINSLLPVTYLEWIAQRPRPFVYISGGQGYRATGATATEDDTLFPSGPAAFYLGSKLLGDLFAEHYRITRGVPVTVLRIGSIYGPGQRRGMVARFVVQAKAGDRIVLQDGGAHRADLTFVGDVGQAVAATLANPGIGIVNIGSGIATSALDAALHVLRAAGGRPDQIEVIPRSAGGPAPGFATLDIRRARAELGFKPTPPDVGLARTVAEWR